MNDLLEAIVAGTRRIVEVREAREPLDRLVRRCEARDERRGAFRAALAVPDRVNVIAECKRRSPSRGVLRPVYDPVRVAVSYAEAGAAAISVLTEPTFFDGALAHLASVRGVVAIPLLRKDFVVAEYQLYEARAAGADAVLLIVAALSPARLRELSDRSADLGLDVLVEVHTADELSVAIDAGAGIIGVNNRNLLTFEVDLRVSEALITRMPPGVIAVAESGLKTAADIMRLKELGYSAFLVGERFMTAPDPGEALRDLIGPLLTLRQ